MNLLFYSGGPWNQNQLLNDELISMIGRKGRITFIPASFEIGESWFPGFKQETKECGIKRHLLFPVDKPFKQEQLQDALSSEAVFLSGGNTFYFLHHLRRTGMLNELRQYAANGGVLFGLSAGSIIMTPRIDLAGLVPGESDDNDVGLKKLEALSLVNFQVYPHYRESKASIRRLTKHTQKLKHPVYAFPDGSGISIRGETISFHGRVTCFQGGRRFVIQE